MTVQAANYAHFTFDQLIDEEKKLALKVDEEFKKRNQLSSSITKMSPAMLQANRATSEKLSLVLRELKERRKELYKDCLGIPLSKKLWVLRFATHGCRFISAGFVATSLAIDCKNATPYELTAICLATAGFGFSLLNQYGEDRYAAIREMQARLQHCPIDDLEGIEALNSFLEKYTRLVELVKPSDSAALKVSQTVFSDSGSSSSRSFFSFSWLRRKTHQALNEASRKQDVPSRRKLAKKCVKKLNKIPNSLLEKYTGHKASYTRSEWEATICDFASFQENPYSSDEEESDIGSSGISMDSEAIEECKVVTIELKEIDNYSHLSLAKLIEQFNILLRQLDKKFNPIEYLKGNSSSWQEEGALLNKSAEDSVKELINKLKTLHGLINKRREEYNRGVFCNCFSMKQKLTALHFCKYFSAMTSLSAVALSSASPCHYDYQARETIKVLAIIAGLLSGAFEEVSFWAGRKETKIKMEIAQLQDAEILDLNSIDQFNYFIDQFFDYVSELPNASDLDRSSHTQELSSEDHENRKNEFLSPSLPIIGDTVKIIQNTARRLSGFESKAQILKRKLTRCLEALKAVDNTYLERIFNQKSAADTKRMWKFALIEVYKKATEDYQYPYSEIVINKNNNNNDNSNINEIIIPERQHSYSNSRIQNSDEYQEKDIYDDEIDELEKNDQ